MTSQQLLPILVGAIVVNVVLIALALASTRSSDARIRRARERQLAMAGGAVSAMAAPDADTVVSAAAPAPGASVVAGSPGDPDDEADDHGDDLVALVDPVTSLESALAWRRAVRDELARLTRYHRPATVVFLELDGFDRLVDQLGDTAGTRVLVATARTIRAEARASDRVARVGRSRFAALLPETDEIKAINFVDRVRSACDRWLEAGEVALRLAIGWVILDPNDGPSGGIQEAARRLDLDRRHRGGPGIVEPVIHDLPASRSA